MILKIQTILQKQFSVNIQGTTIMFNKINPKLQKQVIISAGVIAFIILLIIILSPHNKKITVKIAAISGSKAISKRYPAKMVGDKKNNTAWIPKSKSSGRYSKIKITLQSRTKISKISIINGWDYKSYYEKHNRAKAIRVVFDDYTSYFWNLKDTKKGFQEFSLPQPHNSRTITFYFHAVYRGTKYDQLAISELKIN